jgi:hypothetical protein
MDERNAEVKTAWKELAIVARRLVVDINEKINHGRPVDEQTPFPYTPSVRDFEAEFELYVRKLILESQLEILQRTGTFAQAVELMKEIAVLREKIRDKENRIT